MNNPPRIGAAITGPAAYDLTCAYMPDLGDPRCGRPATTHLATEDLSISMTSCDQHTPDARAVGGVHEHSVTDSACAMPNAMWIAGDPSRCVIDASGVEPDLAAAIAAAAARVNAR